MTDPRELLGCYVTGTLDSAGTARLLTAALADQALFDELMAVEQLRRALEDRPFRSTLHADLVSRAEREPLPLGERARRWLFRPFVLPALAAGAFAAAILWFVVSPAALRVAPGAAPTTIALGSDSGPQIPRLEMMQRESGEAPGAGSPARPAGSAAPATVAFDRAGESPVYRRADPMRVGFRVAGPGAVVVTDTYPDGTVYRLFPNRFQSSPMVEGGGAFVLIPPAGQGPMAVDGAPGVHTIRLLVYPPAVDPLRTGEAPIPSSITMRTYQVVP